METSAAVGDTTEYSLLSKSKNVKWMTYVTHRVTHLITGKGSGGNMYLVSLAKQINNNRVVY